MIILRVRERPHVVTTLRQLGLAVVLSVFARDILAQSPPQAAAASSPLGVWRGTSLCLVRPSPCKDEVVVYHIALMNNADAVSVDARKIVDGEEEEMGVLQCRILAVASQVTCASATSVWLFTATGDTLIGELRLKDGTEYRRARAIRLPGS